MSLDTAAVTSRSNSDLCNIELIMAHTELSPQARMTLISRIAQQWSNATEGSVGRSAAEREVEGRNHIGGKA